MQSLAVSCSCHTEASQNQSLYQCWRREHSEEEHDRDGTRDLTQGDLVQDYSASDFRCQGPAQPSHPCLSLQKGPLEPTAPARAVGGHRGTEPTHPAPPPQGGCAITMSSIQPPSSSAIHPQALPCNSQHLHHPAPRGPAPRSSQHPFPLSLAPGLAGLFPLQHRSSSGAPLPPQCH